MVRLYLFAFLAGLSLPGPSQSYPPRRTAEATSPRYPAANQFDHLSVADGLSNKSVNCILQDQVGYLWFGTNEGLNKYDGSTFTVFRPNPAQPARSLQSGLITGLCEGEAGQIWATTEAGLHGVDPKTGIVTPHLIRAAGASQWNNQIGVYRDKQNRLWISTFAGLARYEPARHRFTLYPTPVAGAAIKSVFIDRQNRFWVATQQGLFHFDQATGRFTPVLVPGVTGPQPAFLGFYADENDRLWMGTATEGYSLMRLDLRRQPWRLEPYNPGGQLNPYVWRHTMHRDSSGLVWVGTTSGLHAIDPVTDRVVTYRAEPTLLNGLNSSSAQAVYHDRTGVLWVGTDNGIDRQAMNTKPFTTYRITPNERMTIRPENRVYALVNDRRNNLWFTDLSTVYRLTASQVRPAIVAPELLGSVGPHKNYVHALATDEAGGIWFGTDDGLYQFDPVSGQYRSYPSSFPIQYISVRAGGGGSAPVLWVGGVGGIAAFNPQTHRYTYQARKQGTEQQLPDVAVIGLLASTDQTVWVLIDRQGLCRLNRQTGRFTRYMAGAKGRLTTNEVESIYEDRAGVIWIGTHLGGLNRFDPRTGLFSAITREDGLPGNTILAITSDEAGRLWLSTDAGLCRYDPATRAIHTYGVADGLPSDEFIQNAVFRQPGQLFFGSQNGLVRFSPGQVLDDTRPFPVYITQLTVADTPRAFTDSVIRLRHDENRVSFSFAALAYEQPAQNQYAYQLVGADPTWVQNGNRHVANFTNLLPGTYTFRVKAANSNGFWTKNIASVRVIVQPPWWATWWAYVLYALLAGGVIWGYIRFYTNRIRQRQELLLNRQQARQLRAVDELKTRFFSNITHEFRTPLSLIIAPVEKLLQEGRFDRPVLTTVHRNAGQLLRLINQLLDLSKLEGNYMAVALVRGNVPEFVGQTMEAFRRAAEQKGIALTYDLADVPAHDLVFDADKWEKILTNLLSNALKFTPEGGAVTVTGTSVWAGTNQTGVQLLLTDSGIGISPEKLPHIFDRFYQADTSNTRAYEGTGIGLALVKELVGLLGGAITVDSKPGVGTSFVLTLPVLAAPATADVPGLSWSAAAPLVSGQHQADGAAGTLAGEILANAQPLPCVLVVEDNDELRAFLVGELATSHQVFQAADGVAGWALAQSELPDIVLTDVMMPRMDGYELTRLIKDTPETDHIAVVMLTAKTAQQSRMDGLLRGADEYLAKPFSIDELRLRLGNLIGRQQKLADYYRQQFALPSARPAPADLPPDPFLRRIYALLDQHLDDSSLSVDWLADQLAMTRKTLYRKVQALTQLSPADLIRQYRLCKAAGLLQAGYSVAETADMAGFSTASHFSLVFREFYRQTPTEFMADKAKTR